MRISERQVARLACRVIACVPVRSPFFLFSHGESQKKQINIHVTIMDIEMDYGPKQNKPKESGWSANGHKSQINTWNKLPNK